MYQRLAQKADLLPQLERRSAGGVCCCGHSNSSVLCISHLHHALAFFRPYKYTFLTPAHECQTMHALGAEPACLCILLYAGHNSTYRCCTASIAWGWETRLPEKLPSARQIGPAKAGRKMNHQCECSQQRMPSFSCCGPVPGRGASNPAA
ncbi:hypothetical protein GQ54DRAFT_177953 [Martensiomyces pterosporus]|nr:hypothetical protein GQ54DRAFT_177953 [Martensiomyces pterosporus]